MLKEPVLIVKTWKPCRCPSTTGWIKKLQYYTQWNIIQLLKNREILPFVTTQMDLERITPSQRVKQIKTSTLWSHLYVESRTNLTGKVTRFVVTRGRGGAGGRGVLEKGDEKIQTPICKINKHQLTLLTRDWFQIGKWWPQGCTLSPCLFKLYAEYIMRNPGLEETQAGIKIAGRNINTSDMQMTPL